MNAQPKASHFINGQYVEDKAGAAIDCIYPATGEVVAVVHEATPDIVEQAIASARTAQKAWAAMSGTERGRILRRAADIMRERNHELSVLETKRHRQTPARDAGGGCHVCGGCAGVFRWSGGVSTGEHIPLGQDWVYTVREPLGVCVGIGGWNYPTQMPAGKVRLRWLAAMQ